MKINSVAYEDLNYQEWRAEDGHVARESCRIANELILGEGIVATGIVAAIEEGPDGKAIVTFDTGYVWLIPARLILRFEGRVEAAP